MFQLLHTWIQKTAAATTFDKESRDTVTAVPTARSFSSLQLPAESSWPMYPTPLCYSPHSNSQRNQTLEGRELIISWDTPAGTVPGEGGQGRGHKWKDKNPWWHMHFLAVTVVAFQRNGKFLTRSGVHTACDTTITYQPSSQEEYTSLHTQQREESRDINHMFPFYSSTMYLRDFPHA